MKRLLCIISSMNAGGAETFMMKIYRNIDREKYQIDFCINGNDKQHYEDEILSLGGKVYRIPSKSESFFRFSKALYRLVKDNGYKNVLRITSSSMGFYDLFLAKLAGADKCSARSSNSSDGGSIKSKIAHKIGGLLFKSFADVKIAPSDLAAIYTFGEKSYKKNKVYMLRNAVDYSQFSFDLNFRNEIREKHNISENETVVGHVGRFQTQKNHKFLIDVFAEISSNTSAKLLLVGDGEKRAEIEQYITEKHLNEKVILAGVQTEIKKYLSAMDVFLFPSLYEGMPNTVIEAQANGLHCIASDTITKEANITGNVKYLPLSLSPREWANECIESASEERKDTQKAFVENGYEISSAAKSFTDIVF